MPLQAPASRCQRAAHDCACFDLTTTAASAQRKFISAWLAVQPDRRVEHPRALTTRQLRETGPLPLSGCRRASHTLLRRKTAGGRVHPRPRQPARWKLRRLTVAGWLRHARERLESLTAATIEQCTCPTAAAAAHSQHPCSQCRPSPVATLCLLCGHVPQSAAWFDATARSESPVPGRKFSATNPRSQAGLIASDTRCAAP
jgi:hypothetical protein